MRLTKEGRGYYEGDKITGYHTYIKYPDNASAIAALQTYQLNSEANEANIMAIDNYLVVDYLPSAYENLTTEDVRTTYAFLEELTKIAEE